MATLGLNVTNLILNENHFDLNVYIFGIRLKYVFYLNERDLYLVWLCREVKKNQIKMYLISLRVFSTSVDTKF